MADVAQEDVIRELYSRRDKLPKDKQAVVDELYSRISRPTIRPATTKEKLAQRFRDIGTAASSPLSLLSDLNKPNMEAQDIDSTVPYAVLGGGSMGSGRVAQTAGRAVKNLATGSKLGKALREAWESTGGEALPPNAYPRPAETTLGPETAPGAPYKAPAPPKGYRNPPTKGASSEIHPSQVPPPAKAPRVPVHSGIEVKPQGAPPDVAPIKPPPGYVRKAPIELGEMGEVAPRGETAPGQPYKAPTEPKGYKNPPAKAPTGEPVGPPKDPNIVYDEQGMPFSKKGTAAPGDTPIEDIPVKAPATSREVRGTPEKQALSDAIKKTHQEATGYEVAKQQFDHGVSSTQLIAKSPDERQRLMEIWGIGHRSQETWNAIIRHMQRLEGMSRRAAGLK